MVSLTRFVDAVFPQLLGLLLSAKSIIPFEKHRGDQCDLLVALYVLPYFGWYSLTFVTVLVRVLQSNRTYRINLYLFIERGFIRMTMADGEQKNQDSSGCSV